MGIELAPHKKDCLKGGEQEWSFRSLMLVQLI